MSNKYNLPNDEDEDFVQNVSGDDFDEFEKKLEQSYQQRLESNNSRPESSNIRLLSGKARPSDLKPIKDSISQPIAEEEKSDLKVDQSSTYNRFSRYVNEKKIERDDFCRPIHIFMTQEELLECFQSIGFEISKDELFLIFKDHNAHKTGYLPMEDFYNKLTCWRNYQNRRDQEFRELSNEANNIIQRNQSSSQGNGGSKKRPTTAVVAGAKNLRALQSQAKNSRLDSANKVNSIGRTQNNMNSTQNQLGQTKSHMNIEDKTKHYLKLAKQKKEEEERALALTIDKGKRETEFDCLHKMGEACEIAKMLNIPVSFSAFKGNDGSLKIHFFQFVEDPSKEIPEEGTEPNEVPMREIKKEITMKEFYREYRKLKRMQNSVKNNYMQTSAAQGAGGGQGKPPNISQNTIVSSYSLNRINKKERQEELKQVLQETMKLTKKLKEQLKILERNGVCGTQPNKQGTINMGKSQSPSIM